MKISREQAESSLKYLRETPPPDSPLRAVPDVSDREIESVKNGWDDLDDLRREMVADIRRELSDANYEVPPDWVADKLVGRIVSDRLR